MDAVGTTIIACSLTADDYRRRAADIRDLARRSLRSTAPIEAGCRLVFADDGDVRAGIERIVTAEAACCPFLTFDLRAGGDATLELDVTGPEEAQPVIAELFA